MRTMIKLTKIDGGMYCFLLTFDPNTEMVNIVDLQPHGIKDLAQTETVRNEIKAAKENQKLNKTLPKPDETKLQVRAVDEQTSKTEHVLKPPRQYRPTDLLSRKEAAVYLGVAEGTLAVWKSTGRYKLPILKIGRLVRYRIADLDAFLERMKIDPDNLPGVKPMSNLKDTKNRKIEF